MAEYLQDTGDPNIPQPFRDAQITLHRFVEVSFDTSVRTYEYHMEAGGFGVANLNQQMLEILRNNPPLVTIPAYYRENPENYLWYSDFFDDAPKGVYRKYAGFELPDSLVTVTTFAEELQKVELPFFRELVNLVSILRMIQYIEEHTADDPDGSADTETIVANKPRRLPSPTRSYQPKMTEDQFSLIAECINELGVFRERITVSQLQDLLTGKQPRLFRITNQKQFTYLFDRLRDEGLIARNWITVAGGNCDFASVNPRAGDTVHFITSQQFTNCRRANKSQAIQGLNTIDELMEHLSGAPV